MLDDIPGIDIRAAQNVIAEIGMDAPIIDAPLLSER